MRGVLFFRILVTARKRLNADHQCSPVRLYNSDRSLPVMLSAVVRDHGDYQHANAETHGGCASADAKPSEDDQVGPADSPSASGRQGQVRSLHQETQRHDGHSSSSVPPSLCSWARHGHVRAAQEAELPQLGRLPPLRQGPSGGRTRRASSSERSSRPNYRGGGREKLGVYACKFDDDSDKDEPVAKTAVALPISTEAKEVRC